MMKNVIRKKLVLWISIIAFLAVIAFVIMVEHNRRISEETTAELGAMYVAEMMYQIQDHFESILSLKSQEVSHIIEHIAEHQDLDYREVLIESANQMNFTYLALCDDEGNYDNLVGEAAWYRNLVGFLEEVKTGESLATTGYLTGTGGKYLVFGILAQYEMEHGRTSAVLLAGFNVEQLYQYIHVKTRDHLGSDANVDIILTNGSYVLHGDEEDVTSFFDKITQYGSFVGMDTAEGIEQIEKAMAGGEKFSQTVTMQGENQYVYGAPAGGPDDWYFVISMPGGFSDVVLEAHYQATLKAFGRVGLFIFVLFAAVFVIYLRMSMQQLAETEAARAEAEIANRAKSTFLSNMSHDIRTPMNAIVGFASIITESLAEDNKEKALEALSKMKRSSDYLHSLVGDVLDMSKIESGMLTLLPETMSVQDNVEMVVTIGRGRSEMKNQKFSVSVHDIIHDTVDCDATRLNQVLLNIIGNAVKFTPEAGTIGLEVWQEESVKGDGYVRTCYVISDNGIGMSPEFLDKMFDSFAREESRVRKIEGTGLGLAISKSLVNMMGGTIFAESTEGEGSKFHVCIDFRKAEPKVYAEQGVKELGALSEIKILLAEDNDFNYDIAQAMLENNGFVVERAENGQETVDKYCKNPKGWDLILMDLRMPIMDGYKAAETIRAFEREQESGLHIPIFALSADVFAEDIARCKEVGMEGHISKPIDVQELLLTIKGIC